jgi:hypothetical protein
MRERAPRSFDAAFGDAEGVREAKRMLLRDGCGAGSEYPELTEFAILDLPDFRPRGGVLRILCHFETRRSRLVMLDHSTTLLDHYLMPQLSLGLAGNSASYTAHDCSVPDQRRGVAIRLTFASPVVLAYFAAKFNMGVLVNGLLLDQGTQNARRPVARSVVTVPPVAKFPVGDDPLDGVIAYLTRSCGGNVHDKGVVAVTSSPPKFATAQCMAKNAVDLRKNSCFYSDYRLAAKADIPHEKNNWLCYDFRQRRIIPSHYAIRSQFDGHVDWYTLKNWVVEVSVDGQTWVAIDWRENNQELNNRNVTRTFMVTKSKDGIFIRLTNVGRNHNGADQLVVSSFEIFGWLIGTRESPSHT